MGIFTNFPFISLLELKLQSANFIIVTMSAFYSESIYPRGKETTRKTKT
jgi:hypothetical protein